MKMNYKLASHQTFTYLPVKKWWMNLIKWTANCQSKNIMQQGKCAGMIDIRIRFNKDNNPYFAHGIIGYKGNVYQHLKLVNNLSKKNDKIYCRVMLEKSGVSTNDIVQFKKFCQNIENKYNNIIFFGGVNRYDWNIVYHQFKCEGMLSDRIDEQISSVKGLGLFPKLWHFFNGKKVLEKGTDKEFLMIDFL